MSFALAQGHFVCLHSCAYGGERKKNNAFLCSCEQFSALEKYCDGSHPHKEWGYDFELGEFHTAKEAEYPRSLCEQYANILERMVCGTISAQRISADVKSNLHPQQQFKGRTVPQIVSEFAAVRTLVSNSTPMVDGKKLLLQAWQGLPVGAKLLKTEAKRGDAKLYVFGIFCGMQSFVNVAKQLLLLEKLANHIDWLDTNIHAELREGFRLTGYAKPLGVFKTEVRLSFGKEQLMQDAKFLKLMLLGKVQSPPSHDEHADELYQITLKEAQEKGWLEGPFSVEQVDASFQRWLPVRRFSVYQRGKVRPIDDMKENFLNQLWVEDWPTCP
eukprot:s948_g11.t1